MVVRILLPFAATLAACTPSPEEAAMRSPSPAGSQDANQAVPDPAGRAAGGPERAAVGPVPEPVSEAGKPAAPAASRGPSPHGDSPAEAEGRRTLSTAFVRVGPDGRLTVELRDGRSLLLRDVVMRPRDFCGVEAEGGRARKRFCAGYAEVAAARPGGVPAPE